MRSLELLHGRRRTSVVTEDNVLSLIPRIFQAPQGRQLMDNSTLVFGDRLLQVQILSHVVCVCKNEFNCVWCFGLTTLDS